MTVDFSSRSTEGMRIARPEPDSLSGLIFALEGTQGTTVLLNGPTGCKYYHGAMSESQAAHATEFNPLTYPLNWYFGQARVPCTFLDNGDYVYGSERKLQDALAYFRDAPHTELLCIVNSPGAALIGDDLAHIAQDALGERPFLVVETPGFSEGMCAGHARGARALIDGLIPSDAAVGPIEPRRVNVLGMTLYQRHYAGDVQAMRHLMESMGLTVGCMLCSGSTVDDIRELPRAALNVVVHPELGLDTAIYLQERFGTPFVVCEGAPIGFEATEHFARKVANAAGGDATPVLDECREARKLAYTHISRIHALTGLPKGVTFGAEGLYSELLALTRFLVEYLALVPVSLNALHAQADSQRPALEAFLGEYGLEAALGADAVEARGELFFGTGDTIARLRLSGCEFSGIETALPTLGYIDVIPKTYLGAQGTLQLIEAVLNGLLF